MGPDSDCGLLWVHAAEFLLKRSEHPPAPPTDWRQEVRLSCQCEDCRALGAFAANPKEQIGRFRLNKQRRMHLHRTIDSHDLEMTHVTERIGSPQTLVCSKTRRTYERQSAQHRADCESMGALLSVMKPVPASLSSLAARLAAARKHGPKID